ncbi:hypothetical protein P9112_010044 [Eukaryota sp. TZLM1-RC]
MNTSALKPTVITVDPRESTPIFASASVALVALYLEHISRESISRYVEAMLRIEKLNKIQVSTTVLEVRSFVGATNFVRDWLPTVSTELAPLTELIKGTPRKISLSQQQIECFQNIKKMITNSVPLELPDDNSSILVFTDAFEKGIARIVWKELSPSDNPPYDNLDTVIYETINYLRKVKLSGSNLFFNGFIEKYDRLGVAKVKVLFNVKRETTVEFHNALRELVDDSMVDQSTVYFDDLRLLQNMYGIQYVKEIITNELLSTNQLNEEMTNVQSYIYRMIVDFCTRHGELDLLSRSTYRKNKPPINNLSFEEQKNAIDRAYLEDVKYESKDPNSSILLGTKPLVGTGISKYKFVDDTYNLDSILGLD